MILFWASINSRVYAIITPLVVFFISGFWHGASWTFIIWGIVQGIGTIWCHRKFLKIGKKHKKFSWLFTFLFIVIAEAIFRSETIENMVQILKRMFTLSYNEFMVDIASALVYDPFFENGMKVMVRFITPGIVRWLFFIIMLICFALSALILKGKNSVEIIKTQKERGYTLGFTILLALGFTWSLISLSQVSTFLYFNFLFSASQIFVWHTTLSLFSFYFLVYHTPLFLITLSDIFVTTVKQRLCIISLLKRLIIYLEELVWKPKITT